MRKIFCFYSVSSLDDYHTVECEAENGVDEQGNSNMQEVCTFFILEPGKCLSLDILFLRWKQFCFYDFISYLFYSNFLFYLQGPADAPRDCKMTNKTFSSIEIRCLEEFDGGSTVWYALQRDVGQGAYGTVLNITDLNFNVSGFHLYCDLLV